MKHVYPETYLCTCPKPRTGVNIFVHVRSSEQPVVVWKLYVLNGCLIDNHSTIPFPIYFMAVKQWFTCIWDFLEFLSKAVAMKDNAAFLLSELTRI